MQVQARPTSAGLTSRKELHDRYSRLRQRKKKRQLAHADDAQQQGKPGDLAAEGGDSPVAEAALPLVQVWRTGCRSRIQGTRSRP